MFCNRMIAQDVRNRILIPNQGNCPELVARVRVLDESADLGKPRIELERLYEELDARNSELIENLSEFQLEYKKLQEELGRSQKTIEDLLRQNSDRGKLEDELDHLKKEIKDLNNSSLESQRTLRKEKEAERAQKKSLEEGLKKLKQEVKVWRSRHKSVVNLIKDRGKELKLKNAELQSLKRDCEELKTKVAMLDNQLNIANSYERSGLKNHKGRV